MNGITKISYLSLFGSFVEPGEDTIETRAKQYRVPRVSRDRLDDTDLVLLFSAKFDTNPRYVSHTAVIRYYPGNYEPWSYQLKNCVTLPDYTVIRRKPARRHKGKQWQIKVELKAVLHRGLSRLLILITKRYRVVNIK